MTVLEVLQKSLLKSIADNFKEGAKAVKNESSYSSQHILTQNEEKGAKAIATENEEKN